MDQPIRHDRLSVGLPVAYLGPDEEVLDWGEPPPVGMLRCGHPGRVTALNHGFHVIVAWVGLEQADVSQVVGWGCGQDGVLMPSLVRIGEDEYQRRAAALPAAPA